MRVLVVTPWFPSSASPGSGVFNLRDAQLIAADHEVTVLHLIHPRLLSEKERAVDAVELGELRVVRVPFSIERPSTIIPAARMIRRMATDADVLHSMAFPALLPVSLSRVGRRKPWLHTEHYSQLVTPPASTRTAVSLAVLKPLFKRPLRTIAVSRALADVIDRHRRTPTMVIGNEVIMPSEPLRPRPSTVSDGTAVKLVGVGSLIERKGPVIAVRTMVELRSRGVDASLTWVGDGPLAEQMREQAQKAGVIESLHLRGHLTPEELSHELVRSDLFLLPVETETFGVAMAEALAHGLPVVATGTGGHTEFLPNEASRLVQRRDSGPLADAVQNICADPDTWNPAEISAYAATRFSPSARATAYGEAYSGLD
ncbi:glycosyltransferase [Leucobacter sp. USCH14]|uniref:glycosyltransferase n=1 Tax=Leucobacter sp. USCH14 TaxID=3024838 RepID=UPI0030B6C230